MAGDAEGGRFYANKLMWLGFGLAAAVGVVNGLHALFPSMPSLESIKCYDVGANITSMPWAAINNGGIGFKLATYPFVVGFAYFIPLDLSFSCWFFYLAGQLYLVYCAALGWTPDTLGYPHYEAQATGAWLALGVVAVLATSRHIRNVWHTAWRGKARAEEMAEAKLYRAAFYGLAAGGMFLLVFTRLLGMAVWAAAVFFIAYFLFAVAITRIRAELGAPHEIYHVNAPKVMTTFFSCETLGPANLGVISSMYWFNRLHRSHPMAHQLEAMKMAERPAIRMKPLAIVLLLAVVIGLLSGYFANLDIAYRDGAQAKCIGFKNWVGQETLSRKYWVFKESGLDTWWLGYSTVGAGIVVLLSVLRGSFLAWPLHPAGYALAVGHALEYFWFAFFVSWLVKLIIVHYGGMKLHKTFVPFFLGLILGDFFIGGLWAIVGPTVGVQTYKIFI